MSTDSNPNVLIGLTLASIKRGDANNPDRLELVTKEGRSFLFYHSQDCCESVAINRIKGSLRKLIGHKIITAKEVVSSDDPPFYRKSSYIAESQTWTILTLATKNHEVEILWYGTSNGYYSESVSFVETANGEPRW